MQAADLNVDEQGLIDCETHLGLAALWEEIVDWPAAPRAVREVPYAFASDWVEEREPRPDEIGALDVYLPFFASEFRKAGPR